MFSERSIAQEVDLSDQRRAARPLVIRNTEDLAVRGLWIFPSRIIRRRKVYAESRAGDVSPYDHAEIVAIRFGVEAGIGLEGLPLKGQRIAEPVRVGKAVFEFDMNSMRGSDEEAGEKKNKPIGIRSGR